MCPSNNNILATLATKSQFTDILASGENDHGISQ